MKSGLFDEVMVSTEDKEIAEVARKYGAKVPFFRSKGNADDRSTTMNVLNEVLSIYKSMGKTFTNVCCIYPTAPLLEIDKLAEGLELMVTQNLDTVFPVVAFSYPVWRGLAIENEKVKMVWPEYLNSRSQDLESVYHDAGQWYWFRPDRVSNSLLTDNSSAIIIREEHVQDIDTASDWKLAEMKFQLMYAK